MGLSKIHALVDAFCAAQVEQNDVASSTDLTILHSINVTRGGSSHDNAHFQNLLPFCFPSGLPEPAAGRTSPLFHQFVLTDECGSRRYVVCCRTRQLHLSKKPLGENAMTCVCLVSTLPFYEPLRACLAEFFQLCQKSSLSDNFADGDIDRSTKSLIPEAFIWRLLHEVFLPPSDQILMGLKLSSLQKTITLDPAKRVLNFKLEPLFRALSAQNIVCIFKSLLLERSVLFHSKSLTLIHHACESFLALLYPLRWEMVYVPIVPSSLKDLIQAPTPFLMGGETVWVKHVPLHPSSDNSNEDEDDLEHPAGVYSRVNLDLDFIEHHDLASLHQPILFDQENLIQQIREILSPNVFTMDNLALPNQQLLDTDSKSVEERLRKVFHDWFQTVFKNHETLFKSNGTWATKKWLESFDHPSRPVLSRFAKTTMFQNFINKLKDGQDPFTVVPGTSQLPRRHTREKTFGSPLKNTVTIGQRERAFDHIYCFSTDALVESGDSTSAFFDPSLFTLWSQTLKEPFIKAIEPIDGLIEQHPESTKLFVLHWLRGYLKMLHADKIQDVNASDIFLTNALIDCAQSLRSSSNVSFKSAVLATTVSIIRRLSVDKAKTVASNADERCQTALNEFIAHFTATCVEPPKTLSVYGQDAAKLESSVATLVAKPNTQEIESQMASFDITDRLILNCDPVKDNIHLGSVESIDDQMEEADLDEEVRELVSKPVLFSIRIAEMITSMLRVISHSTLGNDFGAEFGTGGRRNKSFDPSLTSAKNLISFGGHSKDDEGEMDFVVSDPGELKAIKRMPTYENFKKWIVGLRFVHPEKLITTAERVAFWLNVRNTMNIHVLVEFGPPSNYQHRLTFTNNKPAYLIAGHPFTLNELTYGILKPSIPLPQILHNCLKQPQSNPTSLSRPNSLYDNNRNLTAALTVPLSRDSGLSKVHVTTTIVAHDNTDAAVTHSQTEEQPSMTSAIGIRVPLRIPNNDPRAQYRITEPFPAISFVLVNGSRSSPRFCIFEPVTLWETITNETVRYLNKTIELKKNETGEFRNAFSMLAGSGSLKRTRTITFPQFLVWHGRDFVNLSHASIEAVLLALVTKYPQIKIGKVLNEENLMKEIKSVVADPHYKVDSRKVSFEIKEYSWDFEVVIANNVAFV